MIKCVFSAPVTTQSGYGARSRDFIRALIKVKPNWDIRIIPQRWGNTPQNFLKKGVDDDIISRLIFNNNIDQPDVWIQCTVPNEFQKIGKQLNIGLTAGIETTKCSHTWIEGCNKMDLILVSSTHPKQVFENTEYQVQHKETGEIGNLRLTTPCEVLFEGIDTKVYNTLNIDNNSSIITKLDSIKEDFCFLFTGHWLSGDLGQDRKNVGLLIKMFYEATQFLPTKPALILNSVSGNSEPHLFKTKKKIEQIKSLFPNTIDFAKIYILGGNLTDTEINTLNNHSKIKAFISLTKGEGYGRPLAEFSTTCKPIIATNWSGHTDFLHNEYVTLLDGKLTNVHHSAAWKDVLLLDSQWFSVNENEVYQTIWNFCTDSAYYHNKLNLAKRQQLHIQNFTFDKMASKLVEILNKYSISEEVKFDITKI